MVNGLLCVRKLVGISVIISAFLACILCPVTFSSHTRIQWSLRQVTHCVILGISLETHPFPSILLPYPFTSMSSLNYPSVLLTLSSYDFPTSALRCSSMIYSVIVPQRVSFLSIFWTSGPTVSSTDSVSFGCFCTFITQDLFRHFYCVIWPAVITGILDPYRFLYLTRWRMFFCLLGLRSCMCLIWH